MRTLIIIFLLVLPLIGFTQKGDSIPEYDEDTTFTPAKSSFGINIGCRGLIEPSDYFTPGITWSTPHWFYLLGTKIYGQRARGFTQFGFENNIRYFFGKSNTVFRPFVGMNMDFGHFSYVYQTTDYTLQNGYQVYYMINASRKTTTAGVFLCPGFRLKIVGGLYINALCGFGWGGEGYVETRKCDANSLLNSSSTQKFIRNNDRSFYFNFGFGYDINY